MLTFEIQNFMGCKTARVTLSKLTAICGPNFQGKTSVSRAIYGIMAGEPLIFPKATKSDAKLLVHDGESMGMVSATSEAGSANCTYPSLKQATTGTPRGASAVAMGFRSIADMDDKTKSAYCSTLFGIAPTREDLAAAIIEARLSSENLDALWQKIETYGWDSVHADAKSKGSELKGAWQQATGKPRWGQVIADGWLPETWTPDLINAQKTDLEAALGQAEEWMIAAAKDTAIVDVEKERLSTLIDELMPNRAKLTTAKQEHEKLDRLHAQGIAELAKYPPMPEAMQCPHCQKPFILIGKGPVIYTDEAAKRAAGDAVQRESIISANEILSTDKERARVEVSELAAKCRELDTAIARLAQIGAENAGPKPTASLDDVRAKLQTAKDRLIAFTTKQEADKLHRGIIRNILLVDALAPEGVRHTALTRALDGANKTLAELSQFSGWKTITLSEDLDVTYGGRRYAMCSESEQFRARILLQYLTAAMENAPFVMLDRVDMLDTAGRNRLMRLAMKTDIPTLMFMTVDAQQDAPDLARAGGETYWINGGVVEKL